MQRIESNQPHELKHKLADFGKDVEDFNGWLIEMETDAHQGIGKVDVDHDQGHLKQEKEQLMAKLKAVEMKME